MPIQPGRALNYHMDGASSCSPIEQFQNSMKTDNDFTNSFHSMLNSRYVDVVLDVDVSGCSS